MKDPCKPLVVFCLSARRGTQLVPIGMSTVCLKKAFIKHSK